MSTRVVHVGEASPDLRARRRRRFDPTGTAVTAAVCATVLALSVMVASLSTGAATGRGVQAGQAPEPGPPPAQATPMPGGGAEQPALAFPSAITDQSRSDLGKLVVALERRREEEP